MHQIVCFPSHNPCLISDMGFTLDGDGIAHPVASARPIEARGELYLPEAARGPAPAGSFPAVVIAQGLGGIKEARERTYARMLADQGYVVLVIDTFGTRAATRLLDCVKALVVTEAMMLADAFGALAYLRSLPMVNPGAVSIMGFSYGGMITVLSAYEQIARAFSADDGRFAAHIAYYGCSIPRLDDPTTTGAPVTVLLGELDRNVNIRRSEQIAADQQLGGSKVDFHVFQNKYHQWDGNDVTIRHVPFHLADCWMRLDAENRIIDEVSNRHMANRALRVAMMMHRAKIVGYHILKCDETRARSTDILLSALRDVSRAKADRAPRRGAMLISA